jgi:spore coat protein CotH
MKKIARSTILLLAILSLVGCTATIPEQTASPAATVSIFDPTMVHEINISLATVDWKATLDNPTAEEYYVATINYDGIVADNVGFRTKGNSSLRSVAQSDSERYSYRIKLDKYDKSQTLEGVNEFVINNMYSDASYMREFLSYQIMGEFGLDVPEFAYVKVSINDEYQGLYLAVEAIDDSYIERQFGNNDGNLYKAEENATLSPGSESKFDQKNGTDKSKSDLTALIAALDSLTSENTEQIEQVLNIESALKMIAANAVLANFDSYNGNFSHNYYLYNDNGELVCLPWDLNMSIGGFGGSSPEGFDLYNPISGNGGSQLPLITKLLSAPEFKDQYKSYVSELIMLLDDFDERVKVLDELINQYVKEDPTSFYTYDEYLTAIAYDPDYEFSNDQGMGNRVGGGVGGGRGQAPGVDFKPQEGQAPGMELRPQGMQMPSGGNVPIINVIKARVDYINNQLKE